MIFWSAANRAKEMKYAFAYILELTKGGNVGALSYDMHTVHLMYSSCLHFLYLNITASIRIYNKKVQFILTAYAQVILQLRPINATQGSYSCKGVPRFRFSLLVKQRA